MLFTEEIAPVIGEAKSNVKIMWHVTHLTIKIYKLSLLFGPLLFIFHGLPFQKLQKPLTAGKM